VRPGSMCFDAGSAVVFCGSSRALINETDQHYVAAAVSSVLYPQDMWRVASCLQPPIATLAAIPKATTLAGSGPDRPELTSMRYGPG
jgi:hypothetical protein